jgi:ABC-type nitrate/sulfonate/bicarbonate transport system ATPase subunit
MPTTTATAAKIAVRDLVHHYYNAQTRTTTPAIQGLNLDVRDGEFLSVLGPSGCGKSTLLYIIAGLIRPTAGLILVDGQPVSKPGPDRGVVFQEYALLPWKNVRENVGLGLKLRGLGPKERRPIVDHFIEMVGLRGFEETYPHELSGGMKQRVAVARTLASDPKVMLMDEPFAALDAQTRITMQEELILIWQETRKTILFVTHSVEEAAFLADRVAVLTAGPSQVKAIVEIATPRANRRPADKDPEFSAVEARLFELVRAEVRER